MVGRRALVFHFKIYEYSQELSVLKKPVIKHRESRQTKTWCHRRESDSRPHPYQGCALPLSYDGVRAQSAILGHEMQGILESRIEKLESAIAYHYNRARNDGFRFYNPD